MNASIRSDVAVAGRPRPTPLIESEEVGCPLCGADEHDLLVVAHDQASTSSDEFHVVRCRRCRLAYTNPRPTAGIIERFYPADYWCHELPSDKRRWKARWRRRLQHAVLRAFYNYPPQPAGRATRLEGWLARAWLRARHRRLDWIPFRGPGRLLDFGCGAGVFLERMSGLGWNATGVEISAKVARDVARRTGLRVLAGTLPHPELPPASFDALTMWQSLEHVHQPRAVLRAARDLLVPHGLLIVAVPNLSSWSFERFREHWYALDLPRHLTHFTPATLEAMLSAEGFRVLRCETVGMDGWLRASARLADAGDDTSRGLLLCRWKPTALALARWTERIGRGDTLLLVVERCE